MRSVRMDIRDLPYNLEEVLNRLRINVKLYDTAVRSIMVTSSVIDEGKSFTAFQLWRILAESGFSVCFLDMDLRNSVISQRYNMCAVDGRSMVGINDYLLERADMDEIIYHTEFPNADIVPVSRCMENPSKLLEGVRCQELIKTLSAKYRYVIVDTAPLVMVSDATLIATYCDSTVLCIRANYTRTKAIKQSVDALEVTGCQILGTVLLRAKTSTHSYGRYYGRDHERYGYYDRYGKKNKKKYGYGYGYGGRDKKK